MGKCFRSDDLDQTLLLPPSLHDWLPEKHLARFVAEVVEVLDLGAIYASYEEKDGRGQAAYAPGMMVRVTVRLLQGDLQLAQDTGGDVRRCWVSLLGGGRTSGPQHAGGVSETAFGGVGGIV